MNVREREMAVARHAAQEAGKILNRMFGQVKEVTKKGKIDLLTEADLQSEKIILDIIGQHFPQDSILTEEGGEYHQLPGRIWIIDPLDGTTNFAHNFPVYAVSIALEIERETVLGVVLDPHMGEAFEAVKGQGAFLNQKPIKVSETTKLEEALLAMGFPYNVQQIADGVIGLVRKMIVIAQGIRRPGSAAIDLCYVAAGRVDGFWEEGLKPWDTAAGSLIVQEAGGRLTDYQGDPYTPYSKSIVATNALIHDEMLAALNS